MPKQRLDSLLVTTGLADNKNKARALIMAGEVTVNGKTLIKAGSLVAEDARIELARKPLYVSRGGIKLSHALDEFKLDVTSLVAIDTGASTGGFTDCLLQRGAQRVYAMDVGYGQIDYKLRQDSRVVVRDRTNVHYQFELPEEADLAAIDVSFISVTKVLPNVMEHLKPSGHIIVLLKPQFEAEKHEVGKGGIIKDPLVHARVIGRFILWAVDHGFRLRGLVASPITGADGNQEFLLLLTLKNRGIQRGRGCIESPIKESFATMKKQEVSFKSDNLDLYGELYFPTTTNPNKPALIICHGIPAVPHNPTERGYAILAEKFCANGFITFIFNFRGSGQSQGNFDLRGWTQDLKAAIDFLYGFDEVKKSKLAVIGSSGGAAVSICVAASDPRISSLVTLACPANFDFMPRDKGQELIAYFRKIGVVRDTSFPASIEDWLEGFNTVSPVHHIHKISPRPLLLIHGDQDNTVPVAHAHKLYEQAKDPRELVIIPGAGHRLRLEEKAVDTALEWLKLHS